jgi:hypothetical protein
MKTTLIIVAAFLIGALSSSIFYRATIKNLRKRVKALRVGNDGDASEKKMETMKKVIAACLLNGFAWVWCSYVLAILDKTQIAESLSQVAVTEIIGVVLAYSLKSAIENLSKNNSWPDKPTPVTTPEPEPSSDDSDDEAKG